MEEKTKQEYKSFILNLLDYEVPEKDLENVEKAFNAIISSLSKEDGRILDLYVHQGKDLGYSPSKIAEMLGLSSEYVTWFIKKVRPALQKNPQELGIDMADFEKKTSKDINVETLQAFISKVDYVMNYAEKNIAHRPITNFNDLEQLYNWAKHNVRKKKYIHATLKSPKSVKKQNSIKQELEQEDEFEQ